MAAHSSILAWKILWTEESGGLWLHTAHGVAKSDTTECTHTHTHEFVKLICIEMYE